MFAGPSAGVVLFATLAGNSSARQTPQIRWSAPPACAQADAAKARISAALDEDAAFEIDVSIEPEADELAARLQIRTEHGETERSMRSRDCDAILDAVALIVVSAANDLAAESEPEPIPEPEPEPIPEPVPAVEDDGSPPPTPAPAPEIDAEQLPPPRAPLEWEVVPHLRGWGSVGWGITPTVDGGGGGALGLSFRRLRVEVYGEALAPTTINFETARVSGEIAAWSAGLRGCGIAVWFANDRLHLPICAALEVGRMEGTGAGEDLQGSASTFAATWLGARLGPALAFEATRWLSLVASVELRATLLRPRFEVGGLDESYQPRIAGVSSALGLEVHFPRRKPLPRRKR